MLTSLIEQADGVVKTKFGIAPVKSTYSLYQNPDWAVFCANRNTNPAVESLYLPRTYSAHLKQSTDFIDINFLHEYYGHGLFCEYSAIGQKIARMEQELSELEKLMLGTNELPENQRITVTGNNPYFRDYQKLRVEFDQFCQEHLAHYEGFAYWLEYDFAILFNLIGKWEKIKQKLPEPLRQLFEEVNQFVERKGEKALMERVGFSL